MYYYLFSKIFHWDENAQLNDPKYPHAKKNILIFMLGSIAYLFTAGFLWSKQYSSMVDSMLFLSIIKDFYLWFMAIDIIVCFILFKQFWGWGLLTELDGTFDGKKKEVIYVGDKTLKSTKLIDQDNIDLNITRTSKDININLTKETDMNNIQSQN